MKMETTYRDNKRKKGLGSLKCYHVTQGAQRPSSALMRHLLERPFLGLEQWHPANLGGGYAGRSDAGRMTVWNGKAMMLSLLWLTGPTVPSSSGEVPAM